MRGDPITLPAWVPFKLPTIVPGSAALWEVVLICASIPALMAVRGVFSYLNAYCLLWVSQRVLDDIRQQLRHLLGQSLEFFNRAKASELVQTASTRRASRSKR